MAVLSSSQIASQFLTEYQKRFPMYKNLQRHARELCEQLSEQGISVNVMSRIKSRESLLKKLEDRKEKYSTIDDAKKDIVDVVGLRILVYFPSSLQQVYDHVNSKFDVEETFSYPSQESILPVDESISRKMLYTSEFPGYTAQHFRVQLKEKERRNVKGYSGEIFEIQVASALGQVCAEIQHDILYKFDQERRPTEDVARLIDSLNGLTRTGEVILNQLERTFANGNVTTKQFSNKYELGAYLCQTVHEPMIKKGSVTVLFRFLNAINANSRPQVDDEVGRLGISKKHYQISSVGREMRDRFNPFVATASVLIMERMISSMKRMALGALWIMEKNKHKETVYKCRVIMSTLVWPFVLFPHSPDVSLRILQHFEQRKRRGSLKWALESLMPFNIQQGCEANDRDYERLDELWAVFEKSHEAIFKLAFNIARLGVWRDLTEDVSLLEHVRFRIASLSPGFFDDV